MDNAERMYAMWAKRRQKSQGAQKSARHAGRRRNFAKVPSSTKSPTRLQQQRRTSSGEQQLQSRGRGSVAGNGVGVGVVGGSIVTVVVDVAG